MTTGGELRWWNADAEEWVTIPGGAAASAPSQSIGDFASWSRLGVVDGTTNSFDWTADLQGSAGTSIVVDTSAEWADPSTGNWGYPAAKVTETGTYAITLTISEDVACVASLGIYDDAGQNLAGNPLGGHGGALRAEGYLGADALYRGVAHITIHLAADSHIDVQNVTVGVNGELGLLVQRVA